MNKAVEEFVRERKQGIEREKSRRVSVFLAHEKIQDESNREYAKPGITATEAAYSGYNKCDYLDGELRYYKPICKPIEADMEDCKAIEELLLLEQELKNGIFSAKKEKNDELDISPKQSEVNENGVSFALKIIAIITWFCSAILAVVLGRDGYGDFSFVLFLTYLISGGLAGLLLFAIAEIISLLSTIATNTSGMKIRAVQSSEDACK